MKNKVALSGAESDVINNVGQRNHKSRGFRASGYSGSELIRILVNHRKSDLVCVTSRAEAGKTISDVFPRLRGNRLADSLCFEDPTVENIVASGAKFVFLALPHGVAANFAVPLMEEGIRVIDLSADFRIKDPVTYEEFYGDVSSCS